MIITKDINRKVLKEYFFVKGKIDIDCEYFIQKIKEGCQAKENLNYKTNIKGKMTSFEWFQKDEKFNQIMFHFFEWIDNNYQMCPYFLKEAWGFEVSPYEKTKYHGHSNALWCGALYLNDCSQELKFPEIKQELKPEKGSFALFSPFLWHGTDSNTDTVSKFGISFNCYEKKPWWKVSTSS